MNKRGQFFLIAALIMVGALFGITATLNSARIGNSNEPFYDLSKEVGFETKRVFDYGVYYESDTQALTKSFLEKYADYIEQEEVLFIFGDESEVKGFYFKNNALGSVGISAGGIPTVIVIQEISGDEAQVSYNAMTGIVSVLISGVSYEFRLLEGQNFFFVIIKEEPLGGDNERFVATG